MPRLKQLPVSHDEWNDLPINTVPISGCYDHMLKRAYKLLHYSLYKRSKIFVVRIDFKASYGFDKTRNILPNNDLFTGFIASYAKNIRRNEGFFEYYWVKEHSTKKKGHYHTVFVYDGSKHQSSYILAKDIREKWDRYFKKHRSRFSKAQACLCNYETLKIKKPVADYMLKRKDAEGEEFKACFKRISYLAKEGQKSKERMDHSNMFNSSQIAKDFTVDRTMKSYGPQPKKKSLFKSSR